MPRIVNNTRKCVECGLPVARKVLRCPPCDREARQGRNPYERTPEHRARMAAVQKGKPKPAGYVPASKNPEVAAKIAKHWTPEVRAEKSRQQRAMYEDQTYREQHAAKTTGSANPMWQGGRAIVPYSPGFGRKVREMARERAAYRCEECGAVGLIDTHHKDFRKDNHALDNLEVLCRKCHKRRHYPQLKKACP